MHLFKAAKWVLFVCGCFLWCDDLNVGEKRGEENAKLYISWQVQLFIVVNCCFCTEIMFTVKISNDNFIVRLRTHFHCKYKTWASARRNPICSGNRKWTTTHHNSNTTPTWRTLKMRIYDFFEWEWTSHKLAGLDNNTTYHHHSRGGDHTTLKTKAKRGQKE